MTLADVRAKYDADATAYVEWWAPVLRRAMVALLDGVDLTSTGVVTEIGCGAGTLLKDIAAQAERATIIGVDASYGMLRQAGPAHPVLLGDAQRLPLLDAVTDA